MYVLRHAFLVVPLLFISVIAWGQSVRPLPYSSQLRSDPGVGNIQGIQRYGRPLKTDPDEGEGFSYHVYPVADAPAVIYTQGGGQANYSGGTFQARSTGGTTFRAGFLQGDRAAEQLPTPSSIAAMEAEIKSLQEQLGSALGNEVGEIQGRITQLQDEISDAQRGASPVPNVAQAGGLNTSSNSASDYSGFNVTTPYPVPFDWTSGIRNTQIPITAETPASQREAALRAAAVTRSGLGLTTGEIFHQPLIQIRLRVVEVARTDGLAASSVLEYVSDPNMLNSLTSGNPLNSGKQNFRGLTRFAIPDLISNATTGTGTLVNLTSEHINWAVALLATEMNADIITAPELVTLNGQNVEFVAGSKLPFQLGQNVIQGNNNNIQQVFYKHVGTMVSVTPRIVNWGVHAEGQGEAEVKATEIHDWNELVRFMGGQLGTTTIDVAQGETPVVLKDFSRDQLVPFATRTVLLKELNRYSRRDLVAKGLVLKDVYGQPCACDWKPEDCTIDLSLVVRLSEGANISLNKESETDLTGVNTESNVRAVANVVQVRSGQGVVMAGLIGERELTDLAKIPILGDLPYVGALFRSKTTTRVKTEVLIFVEAAVLDPDPSTARAQSAQNYLLGQPYVDGEFLDNPLEMGMHRVGFGTYLPPHTHGERVFWERFGRKIHKIHTHADDTILQ